MRDKKLYNEFLYVLQETLQRDLISELHIKDDTIKIATKNDVYITKDSKQELEFLIDELKKLFIETFTIECEDDIRRIHNSYIKVILSNGMNLNMISKGGVVFSDGKFTMYVGERGNELLVDVPYAVLKGAQVTQYSLVY